MKVNEISKNKDTNSTDFDSQSVDFENLIENINLLINYIIKRNKKQFYYLEDSQTFEIIRFLNNILNYCVTIHK